MSVECPVSRLANAGLEMLWVDLPNDAQGQARHHTSMPVVQHIARAEFLRSTMMSHGMGGGSGTVSLYGPDLSKWPSKIVDMQEVFMQEAMMLDKRLNEVDHAEKK